MRQNLRPSGYLNSVDIGDGTSLLFHGSTLCIDQVPTKYAQLISNAGDLSFLSPEEKQHLLKRGHLTTFTPKKELEEFRKMVTLISEKSAKLDKKKVFGNLSFILSYKCNLSCSYCFQKSLSDKSKTAVMSGDFVDSFFSDYFRLLFPQVPKNLSITLFGGEPLLPANRDAISRILAYTKKHSSTRVIVATNATALSAMTDLIGPENGKIQSVQVTFDGDRLMHDENRIPMSGKPTFDAMIAAVRQLIQLKVGVGLRIHIHHGRLEAARKLVEYLEKEKLLGHPQVGIYFSPINTFTSEQNTAKDLGTFCQMFQKVSAKTNLPPSSFRYMSNFLEMQTKKILPKVRYCGLGGDKFYIVDPFGDIYNCYEEAGHKNRRIGSCSQGKLKFFRLSETYAKRHLLNLPECIRCSAALFCGGGCPNEARIQNGSIFKSYCHQNKEFIAQTLKAFFIGKEVKI